MFVYIVMNESNDGETTSVDRVFKEQSDAELYMKQEKCDPRTGDYKLYIIKEVLRLDI